MVEHLDRLDRLMADKEMDALICRLPEHVVYLTGTLPVHGVSIAFYSPGYPVELLQPECELEWSDQSRSNVSTFPWGHLGEPALKLSWKNWLQKLANNFSGKIHQLGMELDFSSVAPAYNSSELIQPDAAWRDLISDSFSGAILMDAVPLLAQARSIKSAAEIEQMRRANVIAGFGLEALAEEIRPGVREVELAGMVEYVIRAQGTGFEGAKLVRGFAHFTSGPDRSYKQSMLVPSSSRLLEPGDLGIIELGVCVDGYWSDLTRVYCVGKPNKEQKRIYNAVRDAQLAAASVLRQGTTCGEVDSMARKVLQEAGLGEYFIHGTGHGIGCRYHEIYPQLGPGSQEILEEGMVTSVEPGVYLPGFGGIRIEDNLLVGKEAASWLSTPVEAW